MSKLKLMTILGTRPEIIRLSSTIKACDKYFDHILVHTGQNYDFELNEIFFKDLGLRDPDYHLNSVGKNLGETMGNIIAKSYDLIQKVKPDAVLILGDTNSSLSAISAKRLKCPIFHMEAGNRCWDWNVSEMINRKIVDHISDINLPYTENSRLYLLSEGINGQTIFVTGSPMCEVIKDNLEKINSSKILEKLDLKKQGYIVLSSHREENIDIEENFLNLMKTVNAIAEKYQLPIVFSMHPRSKKIIEAHKIILHPLVRALPPFSFSDYINLQSNAYCVLSDSGTLSEESAMINFPAVLLRTSTERPEALEGGSIVIGNITQHSVEQAVGMAVLMHKSGHNVLLRHDYLEDNVSTKIIRIIQSYTSIANITTWNKKQ